MQGFLLLTGSISNIDISNRSRVKATYFYLALHYVL